MIKHLDQYRTLVENIKWAKSSTLTFTNIEQNLHNALNDPATLTELCAMVIYMNVVSHPYVRVVHDPGTESTNILDLVLVFVL